MAREKKNPSIFYDRGTIGSSEELDEYGVWVKSEPQDLSSVNTDIREAVKPTEDFSPELMASELPNFDEAGVDPWTAENSTDMEDFNLIPQDELLFNDDLGFSFNDDTPTEYVDMEPPNFDVGTEEQTPAFERADSSEGDGLSDIPMMDDFLLEPADEPEIEEQTPASENADSPGGDDLSDVPMMEDFLLEPEVQVSRIHDEPPSSPSEIPEPEQETEKSIDLSTQLLMKIADELSSIRNELSSLKQELHEAKQGADETEEQHSEPGGFFDEEEDEKIALTGDELNTILNTADFTEETWPDVEVSTQGEAAESGSLDGTESESPDESASFPDFSEQFLDTDTAFFTGTDAFIDELPEIDEDFDLPPLPREISPELEKLREEGVADISLLGEDSAFSNLLEGNSFDSSFDFEDEVIEEPNLTVEELPEDNSFDFEDEVIEEPDLMVEELPEDNSFDFEDEVIEEPNLIDEVKEIPLEEPNLEDFSIELDMEVPPDETFGFLESGGDDTGDLEEFELNLDDSVDSPDELYEDFPSDDELLDTADISIDELVDDISADEEAEITPAAPWEDDTYDQVIPEGFVIESGNSPAAEEIIPSEEFSEGIDDSFAEQPFALDEDIMELEGLPEEVPTELEPVLEENEAETPDLEEGEDILAEADIREPEEESAASSVRAAAPPAARPPEAGQKPAPKETHPQVDVSAIPSDIKLELRSVLSYMDQLLESLPEGKIEEFAKSKYFDTYKKLFEDLGLA
jgi:hypothetical protein